MIVIVYDDGGWWCYGDVKLMTIDSAIIDCNDEVNLC